MTDGNNTEINPIDADEREIKIPLWIIQEMRKLNGAAVKIMLGLFVQYNGNNNGYLRGNQNQSLLLFGVSEACAKLSLRELERLNLITRFARGGQQGHEFALNCYPINREVDQRKATQWWLSPEEGSRKFGHKRRSVKA